MHQSIIRIVLSGLIGVAVSSAFFVSPLVDRVVGASVAFARITGPDGWFAWVHAVTPGRDIDIIDGVVLVLLPAGFMGGLLGGVLLLCRRRGADIGSMMVGFLGLPLVLVLTLSIGIVRSAQYRSMPLGLLWDWVWQKPFALAGATYLCACTTVLVVMMMWRHRPVAPMEQAPRRP